MKKLILFLFTITFFTSFSQTEDAWLFLKDKPNKTSYLNNPLTMLSQRALDRRANLNISLDSLDVPIDENYYNLLKKESKITILGKSKWLNALHIQGEVDDIQNLITSYSFIKNIEFANKSLNTSGKSSSTSKNILPNHHKKFSKTTSSFNYGDADNQIKMLRGDFLHNQGLTGENQIIAVIDAGFLNVNTLDAFQRIRENNQILGGYNFADRNENIYSRDSHGTHVLSAISGYIKDKFTGTAPDAKFYLFISEMVESETVLEETLWVEAAERSDSLGVDVINTSLGYTTFDNPEHNHSYADMDGKTTFISRGAEIAASRGMLLVNSAGNSGGGSWKYIGAPADAPSVITVGAVDASRNIASFSSFGPTSDGRIKPEILGQGQSPAVINYSTGEVMTSSSGTSFSSPIIAGLIACLNQNQGFALKSSKKTVDNFNNYLKQSVYESADMFDNPQDQHGYGIPNFEIALNNYIASTAAVNDSFITELKVYPNPITSTFTISIDNQNKSDYTAQIFNLLGKKVLDIKNINSRIIDVSTIDKGVYLLKISSANQYRTLKLIKK